MSSWQKPKNVLPWSALKSPKTLFSKVLIGSFRYKTPLEISLQKKGTSVSENWRLWSLCPCGLGAELCVPLTPFADEAFKKWLHMLLSRGRLWPFFEISHTYAEGEFTSNWSKLFWFWSLVFSACRLLCIGSGSFVCEEHLTGVNIVEFILLVVLVSFKEEQCIRKNGICDFHCSAWFWSC